MKVKVINEFIDKHSGELHQEGAVLTINESRYKEIMSVRPDLVQVVADEPKETRPQKKVNKKGE